MNTHKRYSAEVRERAVRLVQEQQGEYASNWAVICSIAGKIGCTPEILRTWCKASIGGQANDLGRKSEQERLKQLERENRELKRAVEILRKAAAFFAQAEFDRKPRQWWHLSMNIASWTRASRSAPFCRSPRQPIIATSSGRQIPAQSRPSCSRSDAACPYSAGLGGEFSGLRSP